MALSYFQMLSQAKYCMCYVLRAQALQGMAFTVISKGLPSKVWTLLMFLAAKSSRFKLNRAKHRVYYISTCFVGVHDISQACLS